MTYNVRQMMLEGFSFSVNSDWEASSCLYYISSLCSSYSSFLSGAYCNAILPEIFLYLVYYRQCVKQNFLPLLYLVDQTANSIKVFGILVFNLWKTEEWFSEIGTCQRVEARQNRTDWFSLVRNRVENEYDWKYWLGLDRYLYHRQQRKLYHCFPSVHGNFLISLPVQIMKFWKVSTAIARLYKKHSSLVDNNNFFRDSARIYVID